MFLPLSVSFLRWFSWCLQDLLFRCPPTGDLVYSTPTLSCWALLDLFKLPTPTEPVTRPVPKHECELRMTKDQVQFPSFGWCSTVCALAAPNAGCTSNLSQGLLVVYAQMLPLHPISLTASMSTNLTSIPYLKLRNSLVNFVLHLFLQGTTQINFTPILGMQPRLFLS